MGRLIFRQLFPSVLPKFIQSLLVDLLSSKKKKVLTKRIQKSLNQLLRVSNKNQGSCAPVQVMRGCLKHKRSVKSHMAMAK